MRNTGEQRKRKKKMQKVLAAVVIVILLVMIALLAFWQIRKKSVKSFGYRDGGTSAQGASDDDLVYNGKSYKYNDHLSNYLFMGVDTRDTVDVYESQEDAGQADAIFLVSLDRAEKTLKTLIIPRDTITEIEVFSPSGKSLGKSKDHLNLQYAYGDGKDESCRLMEAAVSELFSDIPIQGYCSLNMDGIPLLTDLIGGVEVTVPDSSLEAVNPEFKEGAAVTLTKDNTEQFVRYRDTTETQSAVVRQNREKVFLQAYMEKAQEVYLEDASLVTRLYNGVQDYMITNMGNDIFVKLLEASASKEVENNTVPGEGTSGQYFDEYHVDEDALDEMIVKMFYKEA